MSTSATTWNSTRSRTQHTFVHEEAVEELHRGVRVLFELVHHRSPQALRIVQDALVQCVHLLLGLQSIRFDSSVSCCYLISQFDSRKHNTQSISTSARAPERSNVCSSSGRLRRARRSGGPSRRAARSSCAGVAGAVDIRIPSSARSRSGADPEGRLGQRYRAVVSQSSR